MKIYLTKWWYFSIEIGRDGIIIQLARKPRLYPLSNSVRKQGVRKC